MARQKSPILTILEGRWFPNTNVSVRELFVPLFTVWTPNGDGAHHYEMFTNEHAFRDAVQHAFDDGRAPTIYIAAHGDEKGIQGYHDEGIARAVIRNALKNVPDSQRKRGVYFGSCEFGTFKNAEFILLECPRVDWIVGYTTYVDWIDSSVLDLFFLRHYFFPAPGKGHPMPKTPRARLDYAVRRTCENMRGLVDETEFHVYARKKGPGGRIQDLVADYLADADEDEG